MASAINTGALTLGAIEPDDISKYVFQSVLETGALSVLHRIDTGIQADEKIRIVGNLGLVGECLSGCTPASGSTLTMTEKTWSPKKIGFRIEHCSADLSQQLIALKKKIQRHEDIYNPEGSAEMDLLAKATEDGINQALHRHIYFGDKTAANIDDAGTVTNTVALKYINCIDGIWKQIFTGVTATNIKNIAISANSQASTALQKALAADVALDTFRKMYDAAPPVLKQNISKCYIVCTRTLADNYLASLETKSLANTMDARTTINTQGVPDGVQLIGHFRGLPIYVKDDWDVNIELLYNNGTKLDKPNRAFMTFEDNVPVGTPSDEMLGSVDFWYDKTTKLFYLEAEIMVDTKVLLEDMIVSAY